MRRALTYLAVLAIVLLTWLALTATDTVAPLILPPPRRVATALRTLLADPGTWAAAMGTTVLQASAGFALAALLALPLGVTLGRSTELAQAYEPLLASLTAVPLIVLYPVLAAALGIGTASKLLLGALYAFFPIAIGTIRAVQQVDRRLITALRSMGSSGRHLIRTVVLPSALPGIVTALRIGFGLTLVTVIAAEFIAGSAGVGYQLAASSQGYDSAALFAWVALAAGLTVALNTVFTILTALAEGSIRR
jgi:ABC-type nitrate/sulfonate/bicarbonate transport system permease component